MDCVIEPFVVVGKLYGGLLEITAGSACAAAAAAQYWRSEYGATATWGLRPHLTDRPVFMLARWQHGLGPGHDKQTLHAFALTPGQLLPCEPVTYCGLRIPQHRMEVCEPWHGSPCPVCRAAVSRACVLCPPKS